MKIDRSEKLRTTTNQYFPDVPVAADYLPICPPADGEGREEDVAEVQLRSLSGLSEVNNSIP